MASFIIPAGFGGLSAPRTIYFDNAPNISFSKPRKVMNFGDGYKSILGLGPVKRSVSVSLMNRDPSEINLIEDYFISLGGDPIPNLTILSQSLSFRVKTFQKMYNNGAVYGLSTTLEET